MTRYIGIVAVFETALTNVLLLLRYMADSMQGPTQSTPDCLTCFFWFSRGFCERGDRCKFRHELQDYVARYPKNGLMSIKVIHMSTMEETRKATLASDSNHVSVRDRRNDPKPNADAAFTDTPILDLLLDDCITIEPGSASRVISSIISNIRARRDRSQGVSPLAILAAHTSANVLRTSSRSCTITKASLLALISIAILDCQASWEVR
jgi:hypothetical protein